MKGNRNTNWVSESVTNLLQFGCYWITGTGHWRRLCTPRQQFRRTSWHCAYYRWHPKKNRPIQLFASNFQGRLSIARLLWRISCSAPPSYFAVASFRRRCFDDRETPKREDRPTCRWINHAIKCCAWYHPELVDEERLVLSDETKETFKPVCNKQSHFDF